jgi:F-type H+-transporting ATPase subunit b
MKRLACFALIVPIAMLLSVAYAQEAKEGGKEKKEAERAGHTSGGASEAHSEEGEEGHMEPWKWANFIVLAGGIGYLIGKNAGPFFDGRNAQIRKEMTEAAAARKEADMRAAEVDRRLANLENEIATLRAEANQESEGEARRLAQQTAAEVSKIQAHAEQEIVSAGKAARMELKRYSAKLAIGLAEQKIRARMTPASEDDLVRSFVDHLK